MGLPCLFVRLSGCNLDCAWCDTRYAKEENTFLSIEKIIARIRAFGCSLVEITGGEPLLQEGTSGPISQLLGLNFHGHGHALGVDYSMTISCYDPDKKGRSCGQCDSLPPGTQIKQGKDHEINTLFGSSCRPHHCWYFNDR